MEDKLQVIAMRSNPSRWFVRAEKFAIVADACAITMVVFVTVLGIGILIGMKLAGG